MYQKSKPGILIPIPTAKNWTMYEKNERREKWMDKNFEFISRDKENACYWMMKCLYKKSPHIFIKVAIEVGIHVVHKMIEVEAAAMWIVANVSYQAARIILKHLHAKFKFRVQVPLNHLALMSDAIPSLSSIFREFI